MKNQGLADVASGDPPLVPPGFYKARIINVETKVSGVKSPRPGSPILRFTVKLVDDAAQGQVLFMNVLIPTEGMAEDIKHMSNNRLRRIAIACSVPVRDDFDASHLMGGEFVAVVALREQDHVTVNRILDQHPL